MAKKNTSSYSPLVYSTDPDFIKQEHNAGIETLLTAEQPLKVMLDKKQRAGKIVTLVTGFIGKEEDLEKLGKELKSFCGTGGAVKDEVIIIQGDNKEKIFQKLLKSGYKKAVKN